MRATHLRGRTAKEVLARRAPKARGWPRGEVQPRRDEHCPESREVRTPRPHIRARRGQHSAPWALRKARLDCGRHFYGSGVQWLRSCPRIIPKRCATARGRSPARRQFASASMGRHLVKVAGTGSPGRLSVHSEARSRSRAKASAFLSRTMISAESLPILRSRRTIGRDPNP